MDCSPLPSNVKSVLSKVLRFKILRRDVFWRGMWHQIQNKKKSILLHEWPFGSVIKGLFCKLG